MEGNWGKLSQQRKLSVKKCGLKTKNNVPKGAPAKKSFGVAKSVTTSGDELSKVFAARHNKTDEGTEESDKSVTFPVKKPGIGKLIGIFEDDKTGADVGKPSIQNKLKSNSLGVIQSGTTSNVKKITVVPNHNTLTGGSVTTSKPALALKPVFQKQSKDITVSKDSTNTHNTTSSSQSQPVVKGKLSTTISKFENNEGRSDVNTGFNKAPPPPSGRKTENKKSTVPVAKVTHVSQSTHKKSPLTSRKTEIALVTSISSLAPSKLITRTECDSQASKGINGSNNEGTQKVGQGSMAGLLKPVNKAPPPPRKLTMAHIKSDTVAQGSAEKGDVHRHNGPLNKCNKATSFQVEKNKAPPPPRKQKSEDHERKDMERTDLMTKDNNFNNVSCSVDTDSDEWSSEQEEPATKQRLRSRHSSGSKKRQASSKRYKVKKPYPRQKLTASSSAENYSCAQDWDQACEWETEEDEDRVDSGGYEIVERAADGTLIFRSSSGERRVCPPGFKESSSGVTICTNLSEQNTIAEEGEPTPEPVKDAPARRMDFAQSHVDWESDYVGPDPESDSYTEFDPFSTPPDNTCHNSLPLPPRPNTFKCTNHPTPNSLDRPAPKSTTSCRSPLSQQVQLPPMSPLSPRLKSSPHHSPTQQRRPPTLPSKESITRLSQVAKDMTPIPPQRRNRSIECGSSTESEAPPLTPRSGRSTVVPKEVDTDPPPLPPPRRQVQSSMDLDIPELPPPPPPTGSTARHLTVQGSRARSNSPLPGSYRPPPPEPPEVSEDVSVTTGRRKASLSRLVPLSLPEKCDEGYLKPESSQAAKGYLDMDKQRPKGGSYIDPVEDLASVPDVCPAQNTAPNPPLQVVVDSPTEGAEEEVTSPSVHAYLQLVDEDFQSDSGFSTLDVTSELFDHEPLYQIYHRGAVLRGVLDNDDDYVLEVYKKKPPEKKKDANDIYCDTATARNYVSDILSRVNSADSHQSSVKSDSPSSLEAIVETGTALRTLWSQTDAVQSCEAACSLSTEERKIQEALFEIITSEASYLKSLDLLLAHYVNSPMLDYHCINKTTISKREHQILFSNIRKVRDVSHRFLKELEQLWRRSCVLVAEEVCEVIAKYAANRFDVYVKYCSNQTFQLRELDRLREKNSSFVYELGKLDADPVCQGQNIQSFLTLPMQRVTRLPLLVDAVCHRLDPKLQQQVYGKVTHALSTLQKLVKQCNEGARQMDNIEEVNMIDRMLDFKNIKKIPIVSQSRSIVKKGPLTQLLAPSGLFFKKKTQTMDLFLFNDVLIITKKKSDQCYIVENYSPRISVHADFLTEQQMQKFLPGGPSGYSHLFLLVLLEKKQEFVFSCESMSECARWVEAIEPAQSQNENERIYQEWDCPQVQAVHSYTAQQHDELSLEESDVINVFKKMADGWYEGERIRDGCRGWFPSDHVVEIQSQHVRAKNLRQQYRMLQMSNEQLANMLENPVKAWKKIDDS